MIPKIYRDQRIQKLVPFPNSFKEIDIDTELLTVFTERTGTVLSDEADFFMSAKMNSTLPEEAYEIDFKETGIEIKASDSAGIAHALTTIYWTVRENDGYFFIGHVYDEPGFSYRGVMLDSCRHFFDVDTVKSLIDQAALRKINRFHWGLSNDQGYRIESRAFPLLNEISSVRGGYYTFDEIRDIVIFARNRGVEIVPEINMPGHSTAIIAAYPELSCSKKNVAVPDRPGIFEQIMCGGNDLTYDFLKMLLEEVTSLFPYGEIHIGGDEAPKAEWRKCPCCQNKIKELRLENEEQLQGYLVEEMIQFLASKNKTVICWNDSLRGRNLDESAVVQYYDEFCPDGEQIPYCEDAFSKNRKCIYSQTSELYFDFESCLIPLKKVYDMKFETINRSPIPVENINGIEATLWTERISTRKHLEEMTFPRLLAVAERGWSKEKDYDDFKLRVTKEIEYLKADGVACYEMSEADASGEYQKALILDEWGKIAKEMIASGFPLFVVESMLSGKLYGQFPKEEADDMISRICN